MEIENYAHRLTTIQKDGRWFIRIERILADGTTNWHSDIELKERGSDKWQAFEEFMSMVGKTVGIDSPGVRAHFGLNDD